MSGNPLKLKIAYLYPDILHGFCDSANVEAFVRRSNWRDIDVKVTEIYANDKISSAKFDFYYIGGSNSNKLEIANKFLKQNEDELRIASMASVPMLAVNSGYQLFGRSWQLNNRIKTEGLGLLNVDSVASKNYHEGYITGTCGFLKNRTVVGYENHGILTYLGEDAGHFLMLKTGLGNNGKDKTEGARIKNTIGTYIISPLLAQNPHLCDFFIATALRIKYKCRVPLTRLVDDIEWYSHNYVLDMK